MPDVPAFTLDDARSRAASAPYTFFIPSPAEIAAVGPGDGVKLIFIHRLPVEEWESERMWVQVDEVEGDRLIGRLDNYPYEKSSPLQPGDRVEFGRHNIISVKFRDPDAAPEPYGGDLRTYWDRCFVDDCVLNGEEPVEYIYRDAPTDSEGDEHPDSGWCIRGRASGIQEENDARTASYVALGKVLNIDDSWLPFIDEPVGTRMLRNSETGLWAPDLPEQADD